MAVALSDETEGRLVDDRDIERAQLVPKVPYEDAEALQVSRQIRELEPLRTRGSVHARME